MLKQTRPRMLSTILVHDKNVQPSPMQPGYRRREAVPTCSRYPLHVCLESSWGCNLSNKTVKQASKASKVTFDEICGCISNLIAIVSATANSSKHSEFNDRLSQLIAEKYRSNHNIRINFCRTGTK
ncbi:hypothetical protein RF11_14492 [Thelohanellus kitauei]|uniref:Uncharacterized protein n=1 Tax=Thelohanellus kitauei TaxID=669202 RepID=A0A0C2J505_THEKT|nr:hypothetical protein RF11_14492 [Thelohanellus kitauei]